MMDIFIPLLFMAIFYLGPALLKRYQAKNNPQPTEPELLSSEIINTPPKKHKTVSAYMSDTTEVHSSLVAEHTQSVPEIVEEQAAWQGALDQKLIVNGVIFAEILQPPRAYRPFGKR